jgi:hypothetical protein
MIAKLIPPAPVGALPRIAQPMPGSPLTLDALARVARLRALLRASMPGIRFAPTTSTAGS